MVRTDQLRFACRRIGGAAVASATLGDSAMVASLGRVAEESMSMTGLPFESASVLRSLSDAYRSWATKRARRSTVFARARLRERMDFSKSCWRPNGRTCARRSRRGEGPVDDASLSVIESLEAMEAGAGRWCSRATP